MTTYNSNKWDDWMRAALDGDQKLYRLLLNDLRLWLTAYFKKRAPINAIEDLVQETLMALHNKRHTYDPNYQFGPWISAIARYRWIDHMRATLKYVETAINDDFPVDDRDRDESAKKDVTSLLKLIPPAQAEVIEMVKLRQMSVEEVSHKTGHSPSSVKIMVHRGMKKMMAAVEDFQDE